MARSLGPTGERDMGDVWMAGQCTPCLGSAGQDIDDTRRNSRRVNQTGKLQQGGGAIL